MSEHAIWQWLDSDQFGMVPDGSSGTGSTPCQCQGIFRVVKLTVMKHDTPGCRLRADGLAVFLKIGSAYSTGRPEVRTAGHPVVYAQPNPVIQLFDGRCTGQYDVGNPGQVWCVLYDVFAFEQCLPDQPVLIFTELLYWKHHEVF